MNFIMLPKFALAILLLVPAMISSAQASDKEEMVSAREQGVLYWKKKRFKNAERSLKSALKLSGGNGDFKTLYYLALVNDELLDKVETLKFCERALRFENASPSRRENLLRLKTGILSSYGLVTLERASDIAPEYGIFSMRAQTSFLNPKKRRYVEKLREKFETKPVQLPFSLLLPHGQYIVASQHLKVTTENSGQRLLVFLDPVQEEPEPANSSLRGSNASMWWVAGGVGTTIALGALTYLLVSGDPTTENGTYRIQVENSR